jgi:cytochrome P450
MLVHRRPDLYTQPLTFKPERFLHQRPASGEWFPFGNAVRRCIGASFARFEARIILQEITRTLHITPERAQPERAKPRAIVLVPGRGARIVVARRK